MRGYDVAVVGAGPVGNYIARELSAAGYGVVVFEEHGYIGNPSHCGGLLSYHVEEIVGKIGFLHYAKRAKIHAPDGSTLEIGNDENRAYVVSRVEFDRELARMAINKGADIHLKERVRIIDNGKIVTNAGEYRAGIIVGADGINSVVRKAIGARLPDILGAAQAMVKYRSDDVERVEIFLGKNVAPGFFGWIIPYDENFAKVGVASYEKSYWYLKSLLRKLNLKPLALQFGGIPIGFASKSQWKNMIIVGDAAGQVKATSGGGIYTGLRSAICAVEAIDNYLKGISADLSGYESCWKGTIGKELKKALYLHRIYRKMRDEDFVKIVRDLNDPDTIKIINEYGDIDYPSRVVWKVIRKRPSILKNLGIILKLSTLA